METWRELPTPVKAVIAGIFVNRLGAFLHVFLILFMVSSGFSSFEASVALGAYGAGTVLGVLVGGWLVSRAGVRLTVCLSMAGTAVLTASILYTSWYPALLVVVAGNGAASQMYRPASAELVSRFTEDSRQVMVFAMYRLATNLGTTAAPLLGAALVAVSYDVLFWGESAAAMAVVLLSWRLLPADRPGFADVGTAEVPCDGRESAGPPSHSTTSGYAELLRDRRFVLFLLAITGYSAVYTQYLATLPLAVRADGHETAVYSALVAVNGAIVICCELVVTRWVQRWQARWATVLGILAVGAGLSAYALPFGVGGMVLATVVWSLGEVIGSPTMVAHPARVAPLRLRSRYIGAAQGGFGLGSVAGPVLGVAAWGAYGDAVWLMCGGLACVAAFAAHRGLSRAPDTVV